MARSEADRVEDLSICPTNVGTNTTSVVLIIAEKAVDLITEDLKQGEIVSNKRV